MKETLRILNKMETDGVIGKYAIGGAVGASFYLEPFTTKDLDVFTIMPVPTGSKLVSLTSIYEYLQARGFLPQGQFVLIHDWAVEFLAPATALEIDAIEKAVRIIVEDVETSVMSAEHLAAICLQTGRTKDRYRILAFIEQQALNLPKLLRLVDTYGLKTKWKEFERLDLRRSGTRSRRTTKDDRRRYLQQLPATKKAQLLDELRDAGELFRKARRSEN